MVSLNTVTEEVFIEAHRLNWIIKGQLIPDGWSTNDIKITYTNYTKRAWGKQESWVYQEGFDNAFAKRFPDSVFPDFVIKENDND